MAVRVTVSFLSGIKAGTVEVYPNPPDFRLRFGRDPACEVRFDPVRDDRVSRHHAVLEFHPEPEPHWTLTDLISSNGTAIDGGRIEGCVRVEDGATVEFGPPGPRVRLRLQQDITSELPARPVTQNLPRVE
jgi:pSer/pThr/pTyr-binding forkhead associated (FHA) protein